MRIKRLIGTAALVVACTLGFTARAALVWTQDTGWQVEGGVLANVFGENVNVSNALQAMNEGQAALDEGDNWRALGYFQIVITQYPDSIFAPEAYFQMSKAYVNRGQFENAYESLQEIIKRYPDYPKFNQVIGEQYNIASIIQGGATPYLWGWFPWFTNYNDAIKIYESVVKDAPYSDYAPIALMNIALIAEQETKYEIAFDALDRLINTYPSSMFAPDGYLQMAKIYKDLVEGPDYDQAPTRSAISFYSDYLVLFPEEASIANAEEGLEQMQDTYARSRLVMGDFYYYYRSNNIAASIFYNETITIAPTSPAADEAKVQLKKIAAGELAPMTPYDWIWGRYQKPTLDAYEDESSILDLNNDIFHIESVEDFLLTPGAEVGEVILPDGQVQSYEGLAPVYGDGLDDYLFDDGFYEWTSNEIQNDI